jgi:hypothetical protein
MTTAADSVRTLDGKPDQPIVLDEAPASAERVVTPLKAVRNFQHSAEFQRHLHGLC